MMRSFGFLVVAVAVCLAGRAWGQVVAVPAVLPPGVKIDPEGHIGARQQETTDELAAQRLRVKAAQQAASAAGKAGVAQPGPDGLTYVSLTKVLVEARRVVEEKKELPENLRYLAGLTQVRYVFVYPDELVIAGPAEPVEAKTPLWATGKVTGRPVLHLEDFVVAMRYAVEARGGHVPFGCAIDPRDDSMQRTHQVMEDLAKATRGERMKALKEAIGPQAIRTFGAQPDTRFEWVTIAADYLMKRQTMGLEPVPVPGIGSAVDSSRTAANRFWFEGDYAPLLVSADADAFELRGPRLVLKAGRFSFDDKGATETAKTFAKNFSAKMEQLGTLVPLYAELQNVTDLAVVAALIRKDGLDRRTATDLSWILSREGNFPLSKVPTPRTAETLVNYTNGSLVAGGVTIFPETVVSERNRQRDERGALGGVRGRPSGDNWWKSESVSKAR
jgi:hypothetical protein